MITNAKHEKKERNMYSFRIVIAILLVHQATSFPQKTSQRRLENGLITSLDEYNDYEENWGKGLMKKFTTFARSNNIKSLVAVGGWNEGSAKYSQMVSTAEGRENFANSAVALVEKRGFDGLDLDWEYPTKRGGSTQDKASRKSKKTFHFANG
ncbi:hypothetical protein C0J52_14235 [Blattella germanica]|nr:hypothetical protein C0J52_14235 [Blattella germanica]